MINMQLIVLLLKVKEERINREFVNLIHQGDLEFPDKKPKVGSKSHTNMIPAE